MTGGIVLKKLMLVLTLIVAASLCAIPQLKPNAKISMEQAKAIALQKENGTVKSSELEIEHGRWIYSLDISTPNGIREVNIDANTGRVVEDSKETAADESKEAAQEKKQKHSKNKTQSQRPQ
jgi:hypothetical protein